MIDTIKKPLNSKKTNQMHHTKTIKNYIIIEKVISKRGQPQLAFSAVMGGPSQWMRGQQDEVRSTSSLGSGTPSVFEFSLQECVYFCVCFLKNNFAFAFVITLSLCWVFVAAQAFSRCSKQGLLELWGPCFSWPWLLLLQSTGSRVFRLQQLQFQGSVAAAYQLSCSRACGIFPDQGLNLCPLHWQVDS